MVGDLPLSEGPPTSVRPESAGSLLEWQGKDGTLQERLWVSAADVPAHQEERAWPRRQAGFTAEFGDWNKAAAGRPSQIKLVTVSPQVDLRLTYREFTPNPSLTPADLAIPWPPGVTEQPLRP